MKFYLKMAIQSSFKDKQKFIHNIVGIAIGVMLLLLVTMMSMSFPAETARQRFSVLR